MIDWLQSDSAKLILDNAKILAETISVLVATIGGVFGGLVSVCMALIPYIQGRNQKQKDEDFSYLSQMCVRLTYIKETLVCYKPDMILSLLVRDGRQLEPRRINLIENMRNQLSSYASATLNFLSETRDQYPGGVGWSDSLSKLISLLFVLQNLSSSVSGFYIWTSGDDIEKRENEYDDYIRTLEKMIELIRIRQGNLEKRIFCSPFFSRKH